MGKSDKFRDFYLTRQKRKGRLPRHLPGKKRCAGPPIAAAGRCRRRIRRSEALFVRLFKMHKNRIFFVRTLLTK